MSKILYTSGTGSSQTTNQSETYKLPVYSSEQDIRDDLPNLEVGDIVASDDPNENETLATLMAKVQDLEEKVEADSIYSDTETKTSKVWIDSNGIRHNVYRKRIPFANNSVTGTMPSNVDEVIYLGGIGTYNNTTWLDLSSCRDGVWWFVMQYNKSTNTFAFDTNYSFSGFIEMEYTKTTD